MEAVLKHDHGARVNMDPDTMDGSSPRVAWTRSSAHGGRAPGARLEVDGFSAARFAPVRLRSRQHRSPVRSSTRSARRRSAGRRSDRHRAAEPDAGLTPMVLDLTRQRFFVDRVFASAGGVTGGAVIYDVVVYPDLYADRDVQRVEPGTEFPIVAFSRRAPAAAVVEKWGGKFYFTDEARDRNELSQFTKAMRQLSNTIVRKINQRGVQILEAFITANSRTVVGVSWGSVNTTYAAAANWPLFPARDFAKADLIAEQEEMDMDYNLWILNPNEMFNLEGIYGDKLGALLDSYDIDIFVTNRIAAGTAYALAEGQVGEMRVEQPLRRRRGATRTGSSRPGSSPRSAR
jgi:hypothetical protein